MKADSLIQVLEPSAEMELWTFRLLHNKLLELYEAGNLTIIDGMLSYDEAISHKEISEIFGFITQQLGIDSAKIWEIYCKYSK